MEGDLFWLCFKDGDSYELSPYRAETRHDALRHGMEHVLDRELVAMFSDNLTLTQDEMLKLAPPLLALVSREWSTSSSRPVSYRSKAMP